MFCFVFSALRSFQKRKLSHQPLPSTNECVACDVSGGNAASLMKCPNCGGQCMFLVFPPPSFLDHLILKDMTSSDHPDCTGLSDSQLEKARKYPWHCNDCKICFRCATPGDEESMLLCDSCDRGFHMHCTNPPTTTVPEGEWICEVCK